jgi:hypothetical protein
MPSSGSRAIPSAAPIRLTETRFVKQIDGGIVPIEAADLWPTNGGGLYEIRVKVPSVVPIVGRMDPPTYSVTAFARGYGSANSAQLGPLTEGENFVPTIVLPRADSYVSGGVVDASGKPVAGVRVSVSFPPTQSSRRSAGAQTDAQGRFRIDELVIGETAWLSASMGGQSARIPITPPASDVTVALQRQGGQ